MEYVLTNDGAALMTKAVSGNDLIFTRAETAAGYSSSPETLSNVIGKCQEMNIEVSHDGSDLKLVCFLTNHQLEEAYTLKQIGVYARLADDAEDTLVIIGQQYNGEVIHPAAEGEAEYEFTILMKASGTASITVENGAGSLALKKDLNAHTNRQDNPHNVTAKQLGLDKIPNVSTNDQTPEFEMADERENIESGDKLSVLFSKIKKWFSDLKAGAFATIANNLNTTEAGSVLDARQGKVLHDLIEEQNNNLAQLGGFAPVIDPDTGKITGYTTTIGGADTVFPFKSRVVLKNFYNYRNWEIVMENNFKTITFDLFMPANSNSSMLAKYPQQLLIDGSDDGSSWTNIYSKKKTVVEAATYTGESVDIPNYKYLKFHSGTNGSYLCSYEGADIISNIAWN